MSADAATCALVMITALQVVDALQYAVQVGSHSEGSSSNASDKADANTGLAGAVHRLCGRASRRGLPQLSDFLETHTHTQRMAGQWDPRRP